MSLIDGVSERLQEVTTPSRVEVLRAKNLIVTALAVGSERPTDELLGLLAASEGVAPPAPETRINLAQGALSPDLAPGHALMRWLRMEAASIEAIAELESTGQIVPVGSARPARDSRPQWGYERLGERGGVRWQLILPQLASQTYRASHRALAGAFASLDADLFTGTAEPLLLDERATRCLDEALACYRTGLYLAALNLLGAVFEAAWFAAADHLSAHAAGVSKVLSSDRPPAARVQKAVQDALRAALPHRRSTVDSLQVHADLMRDLRNYGIHVRGEEDVMLEPSFTEEQAGVLFIASRRHLVELADLTRSATSS